MAAEISRESWQPRSPDSTSMWKIWPPKPRESSLFLGKLGHRNLPRAPSRAKHGHWSHGRIAVCTINNGRGNLMRAEGHTRAGAARVSEEKPLPWQTPWCLSCPAVVSFVRELVFSLYLSWTLSGWETTWDFLLNPLYLSISPGDVNESHR